MHKQFRKLVLLSGCFLTGIAHAVVINEIVPGPTNGDFATVEILGEAGVLFAGTLVSIEGDDSSGVVTKIADFGGTFAPNGLLTTSIPNLDQPAFTLALVEGRNFTGTSLAELQSEDINVIDAIGIPDLDTNNILYGQRLGGSDFAFSGDTPQLIFRDGTTLIWYAVNTTGQAVYDLEANPVTGFDLTTLSTTFGDVNPSATIVPVPAALWLFGSGLVGLIARGWR